MALSFNFLASVVAPRACTICSRYRHTIDCSTFVNLDSCLDYQQMFEIQADKKTKPTYCTTGFPKIICHAYSKILPLTSSLNSVSIDHAWSH